MGLFINSLVNRLILNLFLKMYWYIVVLRCIKMWDITVNVNVIHVLWMVFHVALRHSDDTLPLGRCMSVFVLRLTAATHLC